MRKILKKTLFLLLLLPYVAVAQVQPNDIFGVNDLKNAGLNLDNQELKSTIAKIINVVLSFLGILTILIILLGGFKWMTSGGNTEKVSEAKKLIGAGVVGLVIILAAAAIAKFVLDELAKATIK